MASQRVFAFAAPGLLTYSGLNDVLSSIWVSGNSTRFDGTTWRPINLSIEYALSGSVSGGSSDYPGLSDTFDTWASGELTRYDGTNWIPFLADTEYARSGLYLTQSQLPEQYSISGHSHEFDDLTDVDISTVVPTSGDILGYDGSNWVPSTDDLGAGSATTRQLIVAGADATASDIFLLVGGASTQVNGIRMIRPGFITGLSWSIAGFTHSSDGTASFQVQKNGIKFVELTNNYTASTFGADGDFATYPSSNLDFAADDTIHLRLDFVSGLAGTFTRTVMLLEIET